jgi:hypothetical protein
MPPSGRRPTRGPRASFEGLFLFFSNNIGCLGSLFVSALGTLILLILLDVI